MAGWISTQLRAAENILIKFDQSAASSRKKEELTGTTNQHPLQSPLDHRPEQSAILTPSELPKSESRITSERKEPSVVTGSDLQPLSKHSYSLSRASTGGIEKTAAIGSSTALPSKGSDDWSKLLSSNVDTPPLKHSRAAAPARSAASTLQTAQISAMKSGKIVRKNNTKPATAPNHQLLQIPEKSSKALNENEPSKKIRSAEMSVKDALMAARNFRKESQRARKMTMEGGSPLATEPEVLTSRSASSPGGNQNRTSSELSSDSIPVSSSDITIAAEEAVVPAVKRVEAVSTGDEIVLSRALLDKPIATDKSLQESFHGVVKNVPTDEQIVVDVDCGDNSILPEKELSVVREEEGSVEKSKVDKEGMVSQDLDLGEARVEDEKERAEEETEDSVGFIQPSSTQIGRDEPSAVSSLNSVGQSSDLLDAFLQQVLTKSSKAEVQEVKAEITDHSDGVIAENISPNEGEDVSRVSEKLQRKSLLGLVSTLRKEDESSDSSEDSSSSESSDDSSSSESDAEGESKASQEARQRIASMEAEVEREAYISAAMAKESAALAAVKAAFQERSMVAEKLSEEMEEERRAAVELSEEQAKEIAELRSIVLKKLELVNAEKEAHSLTRVDTLNREAQLEAENSAQMRALAAAQRALEESVGNVGKLKSQIEALESSISSCERLKEAAWKRIHFPAAEQSTPRHRFMEADNDVSALDLLIEERKVVIGELEAELAAAQESLSQPTPVEVELELRLRQLIDQLLQTQSHVESLASEKAMVALRLETSSAALREHKSAGARRKRNIRLLHSSEYEEEDLEVGMSRAYALNRSRKQSVLEHDFGGSINEFLTQLADVAWGVDTLVIGGASYIRTNGTVRRIVWIYLLLLHVWVLFVWVVHRNVPPLLETTLV